MSDALDAFAAQQAAPTPVDALDAFAAAPVPKPKPVVNAPVAAAPNGWMDSLKSFGSGLEQSVTGGLGSIEDAMTSGMKSLGIPMQDTNAPVPKGYTGSGVPGFAPAPGGSSTMLPGMNYQPQTTAGHYAQTIGQFAPGLLTGPEGIIPRVASVVAPAVGSEALGQTDFGKTHPVISRVAGALLGSGVAGAGERVASSLMNGGEDAANAANAVTPKNAAAAKLLIGTLGKDRLSPSDAVNALQNDTTGQMTLADLGGENSNTQRLARALVTLPGNQSKDITDFLNARQAGQRGRVLGNISQLSPNTDIYGTNSALTQQRSVESSPLYRQAFANAGVGPVNYENDRAALIGATAQKGAIAKQIKSIEQNSPGALAARGAAGATTRDNYMDLQQQLQDAESARLAAASKFENTQAGISTLEGNQPLTDSRLNDFMQDPDIQRGMQTGLNIQRRLSLARGDEFDPNAYAITGYNDQGMPNVGPVPTWRTLHAGRMGLDQMLYSQADPITGRLPNTQAVNSLKELRTAYGNHLQTLNPDLKAADAAWATPSQQMDAMTMGGKFLRADPEQIAMALKNSPPDYYRTGSGRALADIANDTKDNSNIPNRLNGDQTTRDQISAAYGPSAAQDFSNSMNAEAGMAKTKNFVLGGSQTANKLSDIVSPSMLGRVASDATTGATLGFFSGGPIGALHGAIGLPLMNVGKDVATSLAAKMHPMQPDVAAALGKYLITTGKGGASQVQDAQSILAAQKAAKAASNAALAKRLIIPSVLAASASANQ